MNRLSRRNRFINLSPIDKTLESIESLQDLINLYKGKIQKDLDIITINPTLQIQLKHELGIDW
jgi:hypothetical protein